MKKPGRTLLILIAAAFAAVAVAPAADAATTGTSCGYTSFQQPFQSWGDFNTYVLAPGGSFESGSAPGWTLTGGASVTSPGNGVFSTSYAYSLALPVGSTATSAPICIEYGYPYSRLFSTTTVPNSNTKYKQALKVEVLYTDSTGKATAKQIAILTQNPGYWGLSAQLKLPALASIKPDAYGRLWVRYRFTPLYSTAWKVDDLYVDPKRR